MKIGLVPGAMKPYHAGHHFLVEKALKECDKVFILTTIKDRGALSGESMSTAWKEVIIPNIGNRVVVSFTKSPIGSVYEIIEAEEIENSGNTFRIYGGTEDVARFNMNKIHQKYPNAAPNFTNVAAEEASSYVRSVSTPKAKGEWVRDALKYNNLEKFKSQMPECLKNHAERYMEILNG